MMGMHGVGWGSYLHATDEKPTVTRGLMKRVLSHDGIHCGSEDAVRPA